MIILSACLGLSAACTRKRSLEVPERPATQASKRALKAVDLFDADGQLKGSNVKAEWLEIPLAFKLKETSPRHYVYDAQGINLESTREFLARRVMSGQIDDMPNFVFYHKVIPVGGGQAPSLNLRITQRDTLVRLEVERLSDPGVEPLPVQEAKRALEAEQKYAH
ncbi:MAG TPA: hypothetical protein VFZ61_14395 [Polyangiales bacterium]